MSYAAHEEGKFIMPEQRREIPGKPVYQETVPAYDHARSTVQCESITTFDQLRSRPATSNEGIAVLNKIFESSSLQPISCSESQASVPASENVVLYAPIPIAESYTSDPDSDDNIDLENERLAFTLDMAHKALKSADWAKAEERIKAILTMRNSARMAAKISEVWLLNLSNAQAGQERWEEALATARSYTSKSKDGTLEHWLARLYLKLGHLQQAKKSCKKSISYRRQSPPYPQACRDSILTMITILTQLRENSELEFYESLLTSSLEGASSSGPDTSQDREMQSDFMPDVQLSSQLLSQQLTEQPLEYTSERGPQNISDPRPNSNLAQIDLEMARKIVGKHGLNLHPDGITLIGSNEQLENALVCVFNEGDVVLGRVIFRDKRAQEHRVVVGNSLIKGHNAIEMAAILGNLELARILLDLGAKRMTDTRVTPLHYVCKGFSHWISNDDIAPENRLAIATLLIDRGIPVDGFGGGRTPLYEAVDRNLEDLVKLLLQRGAKANGVASDHVPVVNCVKKSVGTSGILKVLLDAGADIDATELGRTALYNAVGMGKIEFVEELLKRGARVNGVAYDCYVPLVCCANLKSSSGKTGLKILEILLDAGADIDATEIGRTVLYRAVCTGEVELVQELVRRGARVNGVASDYVPLVACCEMFYPAKKGLEIMGILLDAGANIEATKFGDTVLHIAVRMGRVEFVKELLKRGANRSAKNNRGRKPIYYCTSPAIEKMLKA